MSKIPNGIFAQKYRVYHAYVRHKTESRKFSYMIRLTLMRIQKKVHWRKCRYLSFKSAPNRKS